MRKTSTMLVALAAAMLTGCAPKDNNTLTQAEIADGWQLLFDGETLAGWRDYNGDSLGGDSWTVEDGTIKATGIGSDESGYIVTEKVFRNFDLKWEWKISKGGNSGMLYHVQEGPAFAVPYVTGPEYQLIDDENFTEMNDGYVLEPWQRCAVDYAMYVPDFETRDLRPAGEWNQSEIIIELHGHLAVEEVGDMAVVEDDLRLVPFTRRLEVPGLEIRDVHRVVHGAALPGLQDVTVVHFGEILIVDELVFGAGDIRDGISRAFHHMVEHAAVAALADLPLPLEVEVLEQLFRDDIAVLVTADAGRLDGPVLYGPGLAAEHVSVEVTPSGEGLSVEEKLPPVGLLGLGQGIVPGRTARQRRCRQRGEEKQGLFHVIACLGLSKIRKRNEISPEMKRHLYRQVAKANIILT